MMPFSRRPSADASSTHTPGAQSRPFKVIRALELWEGFPVGTLSCEK
jgi:hypothetical protein